jgi:hypothetical protein
MPKNVAGRVGKIVVSLWRALVVERYGVHVGAVMMTAKVHISVGAANEWLSVKCDYSYCTLQMSKAFS